MFTYDITTLALVPFSLLTSAVIRFTSFNPVKVISRIEFTFPQTFVDYIRLAGLAVARSQFYGSVQRVSLG